MRAFLWCPDLFAGNNRHFDANNWPHGRPLPENPQHHWVHDFKKRRIDLKALINGVVVSPWASQEVIEAVETWVRIRQPQCEIRRSSVRPGE